MKHLLTTLLLITLISALYLGSTQDSEQTADNSIEASDKKVAVNIVSPGTGAQAEKGQWIAVEYIGFIEGKNKVFDTATAQKPFKFMIGSKLVFDGFSEGLIGAKEGETRVLRIPSEKGYGERGYRGAVPPNSNLRYLVTVKKIANSSAGLENKEPAKI